MGILFAPFGAHGRSVESPRRRCFGTPGNLPTAILSAHHSKPRGFRDRGPTLGLLEDNRRPFRIRSRSGKGLVLQRTGLLRCTFLEEENPKQEQHTVLSYRC